MFPDLSKYSGEYNVIINDLSKKMIADAGLFRKPCFIEIILVKPVVNYLCLLDGGICHCKRLHLERRPSNNEKRQHRIMLSIVMYLLCHEVSDWIVSIWKTLAAALSHFNRTLCSFLLI